MNEKICDNKSVGVIIRGPENSFALLKRAFFPVGFAPVAGHVDDHGSVEQAAIDEVHEEVGLTVKLEDLVPTAIVGTRFNNHCRRKGGTYHDWWVFEVTKFSGEIIPDPTETQGAAWYGAEDVQLLADRTRQYQAQMIEQQDWLANPGLEEIWVTMLEQLGYIH
jgi:8-oxo-dGTP pyrophosphatase MutT (NUDIX family)